MLQSSSEFNNLGAGVGYGGGGLGAGGWGGFGSGFGGGMGAFGLFGLFGLLDRKRGFGGGDDDSCCDEQRKLAILQAIAASRDADERDMRDISNEICDTKMKIQEGANELRGDIKDALYQGTINGMAQTEAIKVAIAASRAEQAADALALANTLCEVKGNVKDGFYASAIQAINNTNEIKGQAQAFQIANDRKFDELSREGERNTAAILAKINQSEIDQLRDQLFHERRRVDARELEINITNSNTSLQNQIQAQAQAQLQFQQQAKFDADRKFDLLFGQVSKANQDIINVGGYMKDASNKSNPTNIR